MPTWTLAVPPPENQAPSAKTCVSQIPRERQQIDARSIKLRTTGNDWSIKLRGRLVASADVSGGKRVHLHPSTDGEKYITKFDGSAKNFKPQSDEEHTFHSQVLNSICANVGQDPTNIQNRPLNVSISSHFTRDCLWGLHLGLHKITKASQDWR